MPDARSRATAAGAGLRLLRRSTACSQEQLAERSGVTARAIRSIEAGAAVAPRRSTLRRLADALALEPEEARAFVACWYPTAHRPAPAKDCDLHSARASLDEFISPDQHRARTMRRTVSWTAHSWFDERGRLVRTDTDVVIEAAEDGIDRTMLVHHASDRSILDWDALEVVDTRNCTVDAVRTVPEMNVAIVDVRLGLTLGKGETYRYGHSLRLEAALDPDWDEPAHRYGVGMRDTGATVDLLVSFHRDRIPSDVRYVWSENALGRARAVEPAPLTAFGSASRYVANAPPGVHELVWRWPTARIEQHG